MGESRAFPSYTFIYSLNSTYEDFFAPAYLLGYPIQVSLYSAPKIVYEQSLSHTTPLDTSTLHTPLYTSTYSHDYIYEDTLCTIL